MKDLAVIIMSCNKYRIFWDMQVRSFVKFWKDCPFDIYYVSESEDFHFSNEFIAEVGNASLTNLSRRYKFIKTNTPSTSAADWSKMLLSALLYIPHSHIIYMQEDYILKKPSDTSKILRVIDAIRRLNINYVRFYAAPKPMGELKISTPSFAFREHPVHQPWRTSLQVAAWNKHTLVELLLASPGVTPWQFERINTHSGLKNFFCLDLEEYDQDLLHYADTYMSSHGWGIIEQTRAMLLENSFNYTLNGDLIDLDFKL